MHIDHLAIWTPNLERLKSFYETFFSAQSGPGYTNPRTGFSSYFLTFSSGARLELMHRPDIPLSRNDVQAQFTGLIHLSISVGSPEMVDTLTQRLEAAGYPVLDGPRHTGDGYYESQILDPDGNRLEITV